MEEAADHISIFEEFTTDLNKDHPEQIVEWRQSILLWESGDMSGRSPYDIDGEGMSSYLTRTGIHVNRDVQQWSH